MTLKDAKIFRDYILSKAGVNCTVPIGNGRGPEGYFPMSVLRDGPHYWTSRAEFRTWQAKQLRERRRIVREYEAILRRRPKQRRRSPIELMIDRACGLA